MQENVTEGYDPDIYNYENFLPSGLGMGFTGSHRTGKTTLATEISRLGGGPFLASSASAIAAEMGIDLSRKIQFLDRLAFQERLLDVFSKLYEGQAERFISDRTPLDLAAYLIADVPNDLSDADLIKRVDDYVAKSFDVINGNFATVILIQPGIEYVDAPGKPPNNSAYQEAINTICIGLLHDERLKIPAVMLDRGITDLQERVLQSVEVIGMTMRIISHNMRKLASC